MQDTHRCVLHSFSIKNIFYDKMGLRLFYVHVAIYFVNFFCGNMAWCLILPRTLEKKIIKIFRLLVPFRKVWVEIGFIEILVDLFPRLKRH